METATPFTLRDGYTTYLRRWGDSEGTSVFLAGHGLVSHSGVFARLGDELARRNRSLVAIDRRGAGMCTVGRGDYHAPEKLVDDVVYLAEREATKAPNRSVHLIAWCGFAPTAILAAARAPDRFATLTFIAPLFEGVRSAFGERCLSAVFAAAEGQPDDAMIPAPAWSTAFVEERDVPEVENDPHILRQLTLRSLTGVRPNMVEARSAVRTLSVPQAAIIGLRDRILEPAKCRALVSEWIPPSRVFDVDAPHAPWYSRLTEVTDILERMASS